jgi:uncharacterized lipoprotein YehR (DUF1307 family)
MWHNAPGHFFPRMSMKSVCGSEKDKTWKDRHGQSEIDMDMTEIDMDMTEMDMTEIDMDMTEIDMDRAR